MSADELLDVLDDQGHPTGHTATRAQIHTEGLWHRSVHVWIVNSRGEILIQKHSMSKDDHPGEWDSQSGGHLRAGQSAVAGAVRELNEELGLTVAPEQFELLFEKTYQSQRPGYINNEFNPVFLLTVDRPVGDFTFKDGEVDELRWVTPAQLESLLAANQCLAHGDEEPRVITIVRKRFGVR